jgi:hypothetical protein
MATNTTPVSPNPNEPPQGVLFQGKYYKTLDELNAAMTQAGYVINKQTDPNAPVIKSYDPTKDDRSLEQQRLDKRATLDAYKRWAAEDTSGVEKPGNVWIPGQTPVINIDRVGIFSKYAGAGSSQSFSVQFNPGSNQQVGAVIGKDIGSLVKAPFQFFKNHIGSPIANVSSNIADTVAPEWSEDIVGGLVNSVEWVAALGYDNFLKPTLRGSFSALMLPFEILENLAMFFVGDPYLLLVNPSDYEASQASWKERIGAIGGNTTFWQYGLESWKSRGKYAAGGEGLFVQGPALEAKNRLEESIRPTIYGQTATVGRTLWAPIVETGLVQAGDDIHSLLTGMTDAVFQLYADPLTWMNIADYFRGLGVVTDLPTSPASARQLAKLAEKGIVVDPDLWKDTKRAREFLQQADDIDQNVIEILQPRQGVVYSGDRYNPQISRNNFYDIDNPNANRNHENLLGQGLYVTDSPYVATSYSPESALIRDETLPQNIVEGIGREVGAVPITQTQEGSARVYRFEFTPEMNIVDGELSFAELSTSATTGQKTPWGIDPLLEDFGLTPNFANDFFNRLSNSGFPLDGNDIEQIVSTYNSDYIFRSLRENIENKPLIEVMRKFENISQLPESIFFKGYNWGDAPLTPFAKKIFDGESAASRTIKQNYIESATKAIVEKFTEQAANKVLQGYPEIDYMNTFDQLSTGLFNDLLGTGQSPKLFAVKQGDTYVPLNSLNQFEFGINQADYAFRPEINFYLDSAENVSSRANAFDRITSLYGVSDSDKWNKVYNYNGLDIYAATAGEFFDGAAPAIREIVQKSPMNPELIGRAIAETYAAYNPGGIGKNIFLRNNLELFDVNNLIGDVGNFAEVKLVITQNGELGFDFGYLKNLGPKQDKILFNDWLASKGVDGVRYDGGARIGTYGFHNAYTVFRPSKMQIADSLTGSKIPTNEAINLLDEGNRIRNHADDIAKARGLASTAGLLQEGSKVAADANQWEVFKTGGRWRNTAQLLAAEKNPYKIWSTVLKRRSPELATRIARATTPEEITRLMDVAVYNPDPLNYMRQLPGWSGNVVSEVGFRVKQQISKRSALAASMPRTPFIAVDDLDEGARHLDDLMQIFRVNPKLREEQMNKFLRIASDTNENTRNEALFRFARDWEKTIIQDRLQPLVQRLSGKEGQKFVSAASEDLQTFVDRASRWRKDTIDQTRIWVANDMMEAVPLPHLDGNGQGPALMGELFNSNIYLADPDDILPLAKLFKPWSKMMYGLRKYPGVYEAAKIKDFMSSKLIDFQTHRWKPAVLFGGKYTVRVVADEAMRVSMSGVFRGPFSYLSEIFTGRLNKDLLGRAFPYADEANDIAGELATLESLRRSLANAQDVGDPKLIGRLQKAIDEIDETALLARQTEVESILNDEAVNVLDAMIGRKPGLAYDVAFRPDTPGYFRSNIQKIVDRTNNPYEWKRAIADEIAGLASEADVREVAKAIHIGTDTALENVAKWLYSGDGRQYFEKYYKGVVKRPGYVWDTFEEAQRRVDTLKNLLNRATGGHRDTVFLVATRMSPDNGMPFFMGGRTSEGPRASDELIQYLGKQKAGSLDPALFDYPGAPQKASYFPEMRGAEVEQKNKLFRWWMQNTYGVASDKVARVPLVNALKWNRVVDMMPLLSKEEAAKLATFVIDADLKPYVKKNIAANISRAGVGDMTLKQLEDVASAMAVDETANLLFDASKRSLFGRQHALLFPFFDAYRETASSVLKLAVNPNNLHKVDRARRALESFQVGGPGESMLFGARDMDNDGKSEGMMYTDPSTGKKVLATPLFGALASLWADVPFNFAIPVEGLSMQTNVIPGVGPVVAISYDAFGPQSQDWNWLNKLIAPFGSPGERTINDYIIPLWASRAAQGLITDTQVGDAVSGLLGDPRENEIFKYSHHRAMQALAAQRQYPPGEAGVKQLAKDSLDAALVLWAMRGISQFFLPAAPITQYFVETKQNDKIPLGIMLDEMRKLTKETTASGGNQLDAYESMIKKYGPFIIPYFASLTKSQSPGSEASLEFEKFREDNKQLFKDYPGVAAMFFERTGNYDFEVLDLQRRTGELSYLAPEQLAKEIDGLMGGIKYRNYERNLPAEYRNTPLGRAVLSMFASQISQENPYWNPRAYAAEQESEVRMRVNQILKAVDDPNVQKLDIYQPLQEYLGWREKIIQKIRETTPRLSVDGWKTNRGGAPLREVLALQGERIKAANPSFANLWDNLLSREFQRLDNETIEALSRAAVPQTEMTVPSGP